MCAGVKVHAICLDMCEGRGGGMGGLFLYTLVCVCFVCVFCEYVLRVCFVCVVLLCVCAVCL